jgi:hypothetical protein
MCFRGFWCKSGGRLRGVVEPPGFRLLGDTSAIAVLQATEGILKSAL